MSNVLTPPTESRPQLSRLALPSGKKKRTGRWIRRAIWLVLGIVAVAALGFSLRPQPVPVDVVRVTRGDLVIAVEELARTRVRDRYIVAAPLAGNLLRIELRAGDAIEGGAVVARITPLEVPLLDPRTKVETAARASAAAANERQAKAAVTRAEIAAAHAADEDTKNRRLFASGSVSEETITRGALEARLRTEELASARFAAQAAHHEVTMTQAALARFATGIATDGFDVPAPVSGRVLRVLAPSAGPVQPGAPLVEIGDPAALEIVTEVLSTDAVRVTPGARVEVERWGGPDLKAEVRRVEPAGFTRLSALGVEEQRVPIVVDLDEPRSRWAALGDGFRVETRIIIEEKHAVLRLPLGAVFRHAGGWAAFTIRDEIARLVSVKLGARSDTEIEIADGLPEGAAVVVHPSERVKDGARVAAR